MAITSIPGYTVSDYLNRRNYTATDESLTIAETLSVIGTRNRKGSPEE
jgi:hypothetical protein